MTVVVQVAQILSGLALFLAMVNGQNSPVTYGRNSTHAVLQNFNQFGFVEGATEYIVGSGGENVPVLELWIPYDDYKVGPVLFALQNFVSNTKINGVETVQVKMTMAGWGNVATAAVCVNETTPCPDVMVLGTTQLPGRVSEGLTEPLDSYFLDWSREKGQQITDDIVKYAFYDYFIDNTWAAMPLMSDYRILYFNRTVFDQLNLTYPPPLGNWGEPFWKGWTWEVFTDYAIRIKNHLNTTGSGFRLPSAWEEEFYFIQNIFRNYGVGFLDPSTKKCGLRNAEAVVAIKDIVQKLFIDEKAADLQGFFPNDAKFQNWTNAGLLDPLKNDQICCTDAFAKFGDLPGMMIFTPNAPIRYDFSGNYYDTRRNNASDVGLGLIPGRFTFLGGSGAIMTKKGKHKDLAWKLLKLWGDTTFGAINYLGMTQGTIPPYESAVDVSPWNTEAYAIGRLALKRAVPPQYPMTTFPQFAELEARKPFRLLLAEMIYKNITAEEAINRTCQIIDHIFLPKCSSKHIKHELSSCFQNGSMVLSFQWDQSQPCRDGIPLPEVQTNISCTHLPMEGPQGISLMTINSALMLYILFAAAGFTVFRNRASIKRAGYLFSQCTIFGAAMCSIAVYLGVGPPTVGSCVGYTSLLTVGFAITFASFITKLYRIYLIFSNNKGIAKLERSLSDTVMFRYLIALVAVEALLLALWVIVDQPGVSVYRTYVQDVGTITTPVCKYGSTMTVVLMAYNGMLLLLAAVFAFKVRKVPSDFNETKAMVFAVYSVTFIIAIVVPTTTQLNKPQSFQTIVLFGTLLANASSIVVFTAPKLISAFRNETGSQVSRFSASATKGSLSSEQNCIHWYV